MAPAARVPEVNGGVAEAEGEGRGGEPGQGLDVAGEAEGLGGCPAGAGGAGEGEEGVGGTDGDGFGGCGGGRRRGGPNGRDVVRGVEFGDAGEVGVRGEVDYGGP